MTYDKIVTDVKKALEKADTKKFGGEFAFQFNIIGEGEGAFYVAYKNGAVEVAPYDYKENTASVNISGEDIVALAKGTMTLGKAIADNKIEIVGDGTELDNLFQPKKQTVTKTAPKKEEKPAKAEKKPAKAKKEAPKAAAKPVVKEAPKAEAKPAVKEAPKAETKPAVKEAPKAEIKPAVKEAPKAEVKPTAKKK